MINKLKLLFFLTVSALPSAYAQLKVAVNLCDNNERPLGVQASNLKFGWELTANVPSEEQGAYQIVVASTKTKLLTNDFDVWNSGKVRGSNSILVAYKGQKLSPATVYFWKVKVWDKKGIPSAWSPAHSFCTGIEELKDWQNARWIGYEELPDSLRVAPGIHAPYAGQLKNKALERSVSPLFRKNFQIGKKVASAIAFVSGLGQYEMSINGKKVGDAYLAPGWTYYDKTCLYDVLDVTSLVRIGSNTVGAIVGNGFYNINRERYFKLVDAFGLPKFLSRIKITYDDGTTEDIVTNQNWKTAPSGITFNSIYGGEDYDARMDQSGWDQPDFNDMQWKNAILVKAPLGKLVPEMDYPVAVMDSFNVVKINEPKAGVFVYDYGQNASGIAEIKIKGHRGQTIKLIPAEILDKDMLVNQTATGSPYYLSYTLKGDGIESWRPKFTYYGLRYIQVTGATPSGNKIASLPEIISMKFLHTRNSSPSNGMFACSNQLFNRIYKLINWAIKSNLQSIATDCPHREKLGWLEQDYLMGASIHYNFNNYHLYRKLVDDLIDAQAPEGFIPDIAPEYVQFEGGFLDSPEWGSSGVIIPWLLYTWYDDEEVLAKAYPMMKRYVNYLQSKSDGQILSYGLGDWFDYGPGRPGEAQLTPKSLTATAIYYHDVDLLAKTAAILNQQTDAVNYRLQAREIKQAFTRKFLNQGTAVYSTGSQTAMAMPLSIGLVDTGYRKAVLKNLCDSIVAGNYKLTAGDIGFHFLVDALDKGGKSEIIYKMNNRDDVPGYGYQLKKGATSLTESWPALKEVSNNHLMLGHVMEWFYSGIAGIDQEQGSIGFKTLRIRPQPVGDINWARGTFHTPYGWVVSSWRTSDKEFLLNVSIPPNSTANIYLPMRKNGRVFRNGKLITKYIRKESIIIPCNSGQYRFEVK